MDDYDDDQEVIVDINNFACKKCGNLPEEFTIYTCQNIVRGTICGFNYCSNCLKKIKKCCNTRCGGSIDKIIENTSVSRLLKNAKKLNECTFCGSNFSTEEDLKAHLNSCSGAKYICKFCNFVENDMERFWQHMINKHKEDVVKTLDENSS